MTRWLLHRNLEQIFRLKLFGLYIDVWSLGRGAK